MVGLSRPGSPTTDDVFLAVFLHLFVLSPSSDDCDPRSDRSYSSDCPTDRPESRQDCASGSHAASTSRQTSASYPCEKC